MIPASAPRAMEPMKPGLPAARKRPFQFAGSGSQTSKPMRESLVGAENPSILQKGTATDKPSGVLKKPVCAGTFQGGVIAVALVMVTFGSSSDFRLSQLCWADAEIQKPVLIISSTPQDQGVMEFFIRTPPFVVDSRADSFCGWRLDYRPGLFLPPLCGSRQSFG